VNEARAPQVGALAAVRALAYVAVGSVRRYLEADLDLGVGTVRHGVLADHLDRLGEDHLATVDVDVVRGLERVGDVLVADGPVDATLARLDADVEGGVAEELGEALGVGLPLRQLPGALRQSRLQLGPVRFRCRQRETLRDEPVARVPVLDLDDVASLTQLVDGFEQDDVHFRTSFSVIGMIASMRARLIVVASRRWCLAHTPVRRRGRILAVSEMNRRKTRPSW